MLTVRRLTVGCVLLASVSSACSGDGGVMHGVQPDVMGGGSTGFGGSAGTSLAGGTATNGGSANMDATAGAGGALDNTGGNAGAPSVDDPPHPPIDCGESGVAVEDSGPPENRVNYVILGDGYTSDQLDTLYLQHIETANELRFGPVGEPYGRYRKFVNICALQVASATSGLGGETAFDGTGDDESRLGYVNRDKVNAAIASLLPGEIEVDWKAVVLNNDRWWNAGGQPMIWSGAHPDAPGAALHEGGHTFHQLADEYEGGGPACRGGEEPREVNVTHDPVGTAGKWDLWLDFDDSPGTGTQGAFDGGRYCNPGDGIWRPSSNSMMNSLFAAPPSNHYNPVSRQKIILDIYSVVDPIDSHTENQGMLDNPPELRVRVVDPDVIKVDWSVDDVVVAEDSGGVFNVAASQLGSGTHTVSARAYDDTEWVRGDRSDLEQTVSWQISVP